MKFYNKELELVGMLIIITGLLTVALAGATINYLLLNNHHQDLEDKYWTQVHLTTEILEEDNKFLVCRSGNGRVSGYIINNSGYVTQSYAYVLNRDTEEYREGYVVDPYALIPELEWSGPIKADVAYKYIILNPDTGYPFYNGKTPGCGYIPINSGMKTPTTKVYLDELDVENVSFSPPPSLKKLQPNETISATFSTTSGETYLLIFTPLTGNCYIDNQGQIVCYETY